MLSNEPEPRAGTGCALHCDLRDRGLAMAWAMDNPHPNPERCRAPGRRGRSVRRCGQRLGGNALARIPPPSAPRRHPRRRLRRSTVPPAGVCFRALSTRIASSLRIPAALAEPARPVPPGPGSGGCLSPRQVRRLAMHYVVHQAVQSVAASGMSPRRHPPAPRSAADSVSAVMCSASISMARSESRYACGSRSRRKASSAVARIAASGVRSSWMRPR